MRSLTLTLDHLGTGNEAMTIAAALKKARRNKGLTQKELADLAGISLDAYKRCEGGKHVPRAETIAKLAKALDMSTDALVLEDKERSVSEDLRALFQAADRLPDDRKEQLRMSLKGMLLAINQELLDKGE